MNARSCSRVMAQLFPRASMPGQHLPYPPVPGGIPLFELGRGPAVPVAEPERDTRRATDPDMTVDDEPLRVSPPIHEFDNSRRVIGRKEHVRRRLDRHDVTEREP